MKKSLFTFVAALFIAAMSVSAHETITASKNYVTKTVNTGSFTSIYVTSSIDVEFRQGPLKVQLYVADNLAKYVEVKVSNNALTAYYNFSGSITINGSNNTKLIVSAPNVDTFLTQSSGDITIKSGYVVTGKVSFITQASGDIKALSVKADEVALTTQGSGDIEMSTVDATKAFIITQASGDIDVVSVKAPTVSLMSQASGDIEVKSVNGTSATVLTQGSGDVDVAQLSVTTLDAGAHASGDMTLKGSCVNATYNTYGSGNVYARGMKAEAVNATTYGSGDIDCYATKSIQGSEMGSGDVSVGGNPRQNKLKKRD